MEPLFCPYCGEKSLNELEPSELLIDNDEWYIFHYECSKCRETFDKIVLKDVDIDENIENDGKFWS